MPSPVPRLCTHIENVAAQAQTRFVLTPAHTLGVPHLASASIHHPRHLRRASMLSQVSKDLDKCWVCPRADTATGKNICLLVGSP